MAYNKRPDLGQATMANSEPVVLASDQSAIPVTDNSGSLTVDNGGTFAVQAAQSGTWNVTNVSGTVSLPTGASTLAEQQTQTTALQLIDDTVYTDGTGTPSKGIAVMGTDGTNPQIISTNSTGHVNIADGGNAITVDGTVAVTGVSTAANQTTIIGHVDGIEGLLTTIDADTGNLPTIKTNTDFGTVVGGGTETGALRVTIANNSTGVVSVDDNGSSLTVDGTVAATQSGTWNVGTVTAVTGITNALPAGTNAIGKLAANSGVDIGDVDVTSVIAGTGATNLGKAVDSAAGSTDTGVANLSVVDAALTAITPVDGDYAPTRVDANGALHMNMSYKLDSTNDRIGIEAVSTGGASIFRSIDLDESEEQIKATAGSLYGYYFANTNASARYLKFYNATAASVTVGTTTPVMTLYLPPTSAGHVGFAVPIAFDTAITAAATTGVADSDTGAPGANEVILNCYYK